MGVSEIGGGRDGNGSTVKKEGRREEEIARGKDDKKEGVEEITPEEAA